LANSELVQTVHALGASAASDNVAWGNHFKVFVTDTDGDPTTFSLAQSCDGGNLQSRIPADEPAYHEISCGLTGRYIYFLKPAAEPMVFKAFAIDLDVPATCTGTDFFLPGPFTLGLQYDGTMYDEIDLALPAGFSDPSCEITYSLAPSEDVAIIGGVPRLVRIEGTKIIAEITALDYDDPEIYSRDASWK